MDYDLEVERCVRNYGESYRKLIEDSLGWLQQNEPKWLLNKPIDVDEFIRLLIEKISQGQ